MTNSVPLRELPQGLRFPQELQGRILFHPDKHQLEFDGFMSKNDFDRLLKLHNDLGYQRALEELFHKCSFTPVASRENVGQASRSVMPWFVIAAAVVAVISITVVSIRAW